MWPFVAAAVMMIPVSLVRFTGWAAVAWLWLLVSYLAVVTSPRGEDHYLVVALPAVALPVGLVCESLFKPQAGRTEQTRLVAGLALSILIFGSVWQEYYRKSFWQEHDWVQSYDDDAKSPPLKIMGERIAGAAGPGDTLYVEGEHLDLYVFSGVRPFSRFIISLTADGWKARINDLRRLPTFIFLTRKTYDERARNEPFRVEDGEAALLASILRAYYEEWLAEASGVVYRRRNPSPSP